MIKVVKKYFWFFAILLELFLGLSAGILLLTSIQVDTVSANSGIGELSLAGLPLSEVKTALAGYYDDIINNGALIIEVDKKSYPLDYSDFDTAVDIDKTLENLKREVPQNGFEQFFASSDKKSVIEPVFSYNSGKLLQKCEVIFSALEKAPASEKYEVSKGVLKYIPQIPGCKVDYTRLEAELKDIMLDAPTKTYVVDTKESPLLLEVKGESRYKEAFTTLISKSEIPLAPGDENKIGEIIKPLDGVVFVKGQEINLGSFIQFSGFSTDMDKDLLNRIATALYQSALPIENVRILSRKPSQQAVAYSESGLEAVIEGEGANLIMKNDTNRPLMLLASAADKAIKFYIASTGDIKSGLLVVQKKDPVPPPVITSVNKSLGRKETKVVSQGAPGYTVYVSRIIDDDRVELYRDQYRPVSKIVETGEKPLLTSDK